MPTIYTYVESDINVEIGVVEFVDSCSEHDIQNLLSYLNTENHLKSNPIVSSKMSVLELEFNDKVLVLLNKFYQMDISDIEIIENLYKKYI